MTFRLAIAATFSMLTVALAAPLEGAQLTVNSTFDAPDAAPGDGLCAAAAGECTLRAAIQEANALPGGDDVLLPEGVFTLTIAGPDEDLAATGDLDIAGDVNIAGVAAGDTIIDGGGLDRLFEILPDNGATVGIFQLTLRNGQSDHRRQPGR